MPTRARTAATLALLLVAACDRRDAAPPRAQSATVAAGASDVSSPAVRQGIVEASPPPITNEFGATGRIAGRVMETPAPAAAPADAELPASSVMDTASIATTAAPSGTPVATAVPAMIIRTGVAGIEVDSLEPAIRRVRDLAARVGGFVANTSMQSGRDQQRTASIELRVPASSYEAAVAGLAPLGKVESVTETAQDVGEEYVDVNARMANARRLEARLIDLLARRTGKLADVLEVETELARVREEIERYEGRARFLRTRAAVSTLTVNVHEPLPVIARDGPHGPIGGAVRDAWRNFVGFVAAFIAALGFLVPLGVVAAAAWWTLAHFVGRRSRPGPATE